MSPTITLDPGSAIPPYEQIRSQLEVLIRAGQLPPGTGLPTIRQLAHDLGVAPGTVQRAYRELEADGLVESRRRLGTVVCAPPAARAAAPAARDERLASAARDLVAAARTLGVDLDTVQTALRRQWVAGE